MLEVDAVDVQNREKAFRVVRFLQFADRCHPFDMHGPIADHAGCNGVLRSRQ